MPPERILVPIDLTDESRLAVEYAAALGAQLHSEVDLLHVWQPPSVRVDVLPDFVKADFTWELPDPRVTPRKALWTFAHTDAGHRMMHCLEDLEARAIDAHGRLALGNPSDPSDTIVSVAGEADYGLIVMATRGQDHLLKSTIAEKVLRRAPCPVITIRVDGA